MSTPGRSRSNATHARNGSVRPHTSRLTRECTRAKSPTNATRVGKPSARGPISRSIRSFTLGRSRSSVRRAGRNSAGARDLVLTRGSTRVRNPTHASSVGKASVRPRTSTRTRGSTPGRGPTSAASAVRVSVRGHIWSTTSGSIRRGICRIPVRRHLISLEIRAADCQRFLRTQSLRRLHRGDALVFGRLILYKCRESQMGGKLLSQCTVITYRSCHPRVMTRPGKPRRASRSLKTGCRKGFNQSRALAGVD